MDGIDATKNPMVDARLLKQFEELARAVQAEKTRFAIAHPFENPVVVVRRVENLLRPLHLDTTPLPDEP